MQTSLIFPSTLRTGETSGVSQPPVLILINSLILIFLTLLCFLDAQVLCAQSTSPDLISFKPVPAPREQFDLLSTRGNQHAKKIKWGGYMIGWYTYDEEGENNFLIKYARVKTLGSLTDRLSFFLQVDLTNDNIFKDAYLSYQLRPELRIKFGQFKYRFGVFQKPWDFYTINKPRISSFLFGDPRDIGLELNGNFETMAFHLAVVNGTARSISEDDKKKTIVGTFLYNPIEGLEIGGSFYEGTRDFVAASDNQEIVVHGARRDRWGAHIWYEKDPLLIQGEYLRGFDYDIERTGWYCILGFKVDPSIQPIGRVEFFDPDRSLNENGLMIYGVGVNWYPAPASVFRAIVEIEDPEGAQEPDLRLLTQGGFLF